MKNPQELFKTMNDHERRFFSALWAHGEDLPGEFRLQRLASHTFNVWYDAPRDGCYVGKINLWEQNAFSIQYTKIEENGDTSLHNISDIDFNACLSHIPDWITYIKGIADPATKEKMFQFGLSQE